MRVAALEYGSDPSGLICGFVFAPGAAARPLAAEAARLWLEDPARAQGQEQVGEFLWLHFHLGSAASEKWLKRHLTLSDVFFQNLVESSQSTRVEYADETLIAVINDVLYDFSFDVSDISTLRLSVDRQILVSARLRPLRSIDRLREAVRSGEGFRSPAELLVHLLHDQAEVLVQIARSSSIKVDDIEDSLLAGGLNPKRANLGGLRRVLVRLQRLLAPEPATLFRLLNKPPKWMLEFDIRELQQATEEFAVVLRDMAGLQERIKLLQEELAAEVNERNSRSLFVLTIVSVLALPINIVAGFLGMNVGGIPFANNPHGFWIVAVLVATFTVGAAWFFFRRPRE